MTDKKHKSGETSGQKLKPYVRPEILCTERLESVANVCGPVGPGLGKSTPAAPDLCASGAIKS